MEELQSQETQTTSNVGCSAAFRSKCSALYAYRWVPISLASAFFYAVSATITSTLTDEVGTTVLSSVHGIIPMALTFIWIVYKGKSVLITKRAHLLLHSINSVLMVATLSCRVYAFVHMDTADASAITYSYVAFTGIFGRLILKESFGLFEVTMAFLSFTGVVLIARPPFLFQFFDASLPRSDGLVAPLAALVVAIVSSLYAVLVRVMGKEDIDPVMVMFFPLAVSAVVMSSAAALLREWTMPSCVSARIRVCVMGLSGGLANGLLIYALSIENVVYIALLLINDCLLVFLMTLLFLGYRPYWTNALGIFFIVASSVAVIVKKISVYRSNVENGPPDPDQKNERGTVSRSIPADREEDEV